MGGCIAAVSSHRECRAHPRHSCMLPSRWQAPYRGKRSTNFQNASSVNVPGDP